MTSIVFFEIKNYVSRCYPGGSIFTGDLGQLYSGYNNVKATANWDIYKGGVFIRRIAMNFEGRETGIQKINRNTWRYVSPDSENKITLSLKSAKVAEILEEGRLILNNVILPYRVNYSLSK